MSRTSRSGGFLPPLWPPPPGEPGGVWQDGKFEPGPLWPSRGQLWWTRAIKGQDGAVKEGEETDLAWSGRGASRASFSGPRLPAALQRLRAVLLRLQREREELLVARDCARSLHATLGFLKVPRPFAALPQLCWELLPHSPHGTTLRVRAHTDPQFRPLALPLALAIQRLDMAVEEQLKVLGQASPSPALVFQISELLQVLPAYHQVLAVAVGAVPRAAQPFPPSRVLHLLARERGRLGAERLWMGLKESKLRTQLHKLCREERELLPGLLGLLGDTGAPGSGSRGLGGSRKLWGQYWSLFWAACAQSLGRRLGPWEDMQKAVQELREALDQASLPQECEKELTSLCHCLLRQALIWMWDQGFCRALGSVRGDCGIMRASWDGTPCMHTTDLFQQLFPPLTSALQEPGAASCQSSGPGPPPLALGLCTLQATTHWLLSKCQQHLASWAPGPLLLLIQRELPLLLCEAEALAALVSEGASVLGLDQQLGKEIRRLTARIQVLPEESLCLFSRECWQQAAKGFQLHMPQGRHWRLRLRSELPSIPSDYAELVVGAVLGPVLQGVQGLPPQAQGPPLTQALTALLDAWLNHILTQKIRFSLQGALQLRQDFALVRGLLEEEQWGLAPELRQALLTLSVFQRADGALLCLLQQPVPGSRTYRGPPCCCSCNKIQTPELPSSSLNSLENLEPPPLRPGVTLVQTAQLLSTLRGGGPSPEAYLAGSQQAWLALRQHRPLRWHLPSFLCIRTSPEP
ncbi:coiled-coil domain-containing protein 142 [Trichosurus vulpecula]|uniref:coiled-coil domain-containing protein 142 n=1 Tax=Trichosurus vulpecula TaxID=9337 RepID=UPI00186AF678|nr:coiled-coil domain-containing protein 142 [Trichosurus vulpecula]XP_036619452.1 coiled-coil domain-containing protein 142 [Trichosurus vulpecula]XP_036619453.1 coiled-coil domain-containing protein 142 [Trichosurus vulpecula]XP_036619455.1 coiled-coil domain-containing protein 142 [Trichosurus vulpecula]